MFGIPAPPMPQWSDALAFGLAGGGLMVGAVILLWGRLVGRAFLCGIAVVAAILISTPLSQELAFDLLWVRLILAVGLALLTLLMSRLIWAVLAAGLFGLLAECALLGRWIDAIPSAQRPKFLAAGESIVDWAEGVAYFFADGLGAIWQLHTIETLMVIGIAAGVPLLTCLFCRRLAKIFITCLLGGLAVAGSLILAVSQLRPTLWPSLRIHWGVLGCMAATAITIGLVHQYRADFRAEKLRKEKEQAEQEESKTEESSSKSDKNKGDD